MDSILEMPMEKAVEGDLKLLKVKSMISALWSGILESFRRLFVFFSFSFDASIVKIEIFFLL